MGYILICLPLPIKFRNYEKHDFREEQLKTRGVYWLTIEPGEFHQQKAMALEPYGYEISFFKTLESMTKEIQARRVSIIIIGDEGPQISVLKALSDIASMPDIQGARLILSTIRFRSDISRAAACEGFRDIIPLNLNRQEWVQRFLFSTSGKEGHLPTPLPQVTFNSEASFSIPARIVWINETHIWIESRIALQENITFDLTGPIVQSMGLKKLTVTIEQMSRQDLIYRFSEALLATWNVPDKSEALVQETLSVLGELNTGNRCKVFLGIQSPALRSTILSYLNDAKFEVHTALQKRSLIEEPKYFSPHIVFIEDRLCQGEGIDRFREMSTNLPEETVIVIVGADDTDLAPIRNLVGGRHLHPLKRIPRNLREIIFSEIIPKKMIQEQFSNEDKTCHIPAKHEFSLAEIHFGAMITKLHCRAIEIAVPHLARNFGLARIHSPLLKKVLKKDPYTKISLSHENGLSYNEDFPHLIECHFCDIDFEERELLAKALVDIVNEGFIQEKKAINGDNEGTKNNSDNSGIEENPGEELASHPEDALGSYQKQSKNQVFNRLNLILLIMMGFTLATSIFFLAAVKLIEINGGQPPPSIRESKKTTVNEATVNEATVNDAEAIKVEREEN